jgi:replicative DNA helicase
MDQESFNILPFRTISQVTDESLAYIKARKDKTIVPLKTGWSKFNKVCCGGLEPNMILTIAGTSGSGKSAFTNTLETDLIDLNKDQEIVILNFSFEMLSYRQIGRKLSNRLNRTTAEIYSAEDSMDELTYQEVEREAEKLKQYKVYYVDTPSNVANIEKTIDYFHETVAAGKWLIVILDHALLVEGDTERGTIVDLQKMFIRKKKLSNTSIIQISQMNRNIELPDRINNPSMHFPLRSDLAASDAIFQASDFVVALSRPELLNITSYGINRLPVKNKVYLHFLKVRDGGEPCILEFDNELKYGKLKEVNRDTTEQQKVVFNNNKKIG